jgi:MTH538 TIR-like domain (DUF1863)
MARKCFYSFHFKPDNWRAATVRSIGSIEGNPPASDNEWESITSGPDNEQKIQNWIAGQMKGKTCTIMLVGSDTANRKWINYEIVKTWNDGLGLVGIYIHGLKDRHGLESSKGQNPFDFITHGTTKQLSSIVKCYTPQGSTSKERYDWISTHLSNAVEEGISIRAKNP